MKNIFIQIGVVDGERESTLKVLHTTNGQNINFAAERHVATYFGSRGVKEDDFWWFDGTMTAKVEKVVELTDEEFEVLKKFL